MYKYNSEKLQTHQTKLGEKQETERNIICKSLIYYCRSGYRNTGIPYTMLYQQDVINYINCVPFKCVFDIPDQITLNMTLCNISVNVCSVIMEICKQVVF